MPRCRWRGRAPQLALFFMYSYKHIRSLHPRFGCQTCIPWDAIIIAGQESLFGSKTALWHKHFCVGVHPHQIAWCSEYKLIYICASYIPDLDVSLTFPGMPQQIMQVRKSCLAEKGTCGTYNMNANKRVRTRLPCFLGYKFTSGMDHTA